MQAGRVRTRSPPRHSLCRCRHPCSPLRHKRTLLRSTKLWVTLDHWLQLKLNGCQAVDMSSTRVINSSLGYPLPCTVWRLPPDPTDQLIIMLLISLTNCAYAKEREGVSRTSHKKSWSRLLSAGLDVLVHGHHASTWDGTLAWDCPFQGSKLTTSRQPSNPYSMVISCSQLIQCILWRHYNLTVEEISTPKQTPSNLARIQLD